MTAPISLGDPRGCSKMRYAGIAPALFALLAGALLLRRVRRVFGGGLHRSGLLRCRCRLVGGVLRRLRCLVGGLFGRLGGLAAGCRRGFTRLRGGVTRGGLGGFGGFVCRRLRRLRRGLDGSLRLRRCVGSSLCVGSGLVGTLPACAERGGERKSNQRAYAGKWHGFSPFRLNDGFLAAFG